MSKAQYKSFDTIEECATSAVSVFAEQQWKWHRVGVPKYGDIVRTLEYLKASSEDGWRPVETGRLGYRDGKFWHQCVDDAT